MLTRQQLRAVVKAIEDSRGPRVSSTTYTLSEGKMTVEQHNSHTEVRRLMDSDDYKLGWNNAHKQLSEMIVWILTEASKEDLIKYAGRVK